MPQITSPNKVNLSGDEQEHFFALTHKGINSARVITRAPILTMLAKSQSNQDICLALTVTLLTVLKIRKRLAEGGLEAALGELPRPGSKPKLDAKQAAMITAIACSTALTDTITGLCVCWAQKLWNSASPSHTAMKACASFKKSELKPWQKQEWRIAIGSIQTSRRSLLAAPASGRTRVALTPRELLSCLARADVAAIDRRNYAVSHRGAAALAQTETVPSGTLLEVLRG
jgi:hypothetical protein